MEPTKTDTASGPVLCAGGAEERSAALSTLVLLAIAARDDDARLELLEAGLPEVELAQIERAGEAELKHWRLALAAGRVLDWRALGALLRARLALCVEAARKPAELLMLARIAKMLPLWALGSAAAVRDVAACLAKPAASRKGAGASMTVAAAVPAA